MKLTSVSKATYAQSGTQSRRGPTAWILHCHPNNDPRSVGPLDPSDAILLRGFRCRPPIWSHTSFRHPLSKTDILTCAAS